MGEKNNPYSNQPHHSVGGGSVFNFALLVLFILWARLPHEDTEKFIRNLRENMNVKGVAGTLSTIAENPSLFSQLGLISALAYCGSCLIEIYGAYACKEKLLLPFLFLIFVQNVCCFALTGITTLVVKQNTNDLGIIIAVTLGGFFSSLFFLYCTACVYSLWQVLSEPKLRELAEDTIDILGNEQVRNNDARFGVFTVDPRRLPNLGDDLRYTRESKFPPTVHITRYFQNEGFTSQQGPSTSRSYNRSRRAPGITFVSNNHPARERGVTFAQVC